MKTMHFPIKVHLLVQVDSYLNSNCHLFKQVVPGRSQQGLQLRLMRSQLKQNTLYLKKNGLFAL